MLLYTDGIVETRNSLAEEFGESGLIDFYKKNLNLESKVFHENIINALKKFSNNNINDDITLVVISVD